MLGNVSLASRAIADFEPVIGSAAIEDLRRRARPLQGLHFVNLTVTAFGTWHTDLLAASVALLRDLGIDASWGIVRAPAGSQQAVDGLYSALAGSGLAWEAEQQRAWMRFIEDARALLEPGADIVAVHDPQLLALAPDPAAAPNGRRTSWIWHSHIDMNSADAAALRAVLPYVGHYDAVLFEDSAFIPAGLQDRPFTIVPPGLDPLGPRNVTMDVETAGMLVSRLGIDSRRPLIAQISPMTPGSDALGLIEAFAALKARFPELQLAIVPTSLRDDERTREYFSAASRMAAGLSDCVLVSVPSEVGNAEINALQQVSSVVVQKSLERGYALWLSEAMWKEKPVVAGRSAGTAAQIVDGVTGYLVPDTATCIDRIAELLEDSELQRLLGGEGRRHVAGRFLITRYLSDLLKLLGNLAGVEDRV